MNQKSYSEKDSDQTHDERLIESAKQYKNGQVKTVELNQTRYARTRLSLSQAEFADMLGVSIRTLQNWEQDHRKPTRTAQILLRIAIKHPDMFKDILDDAA